MPQDLIIVSPESPYPVGTRIRGFKGATRATIIDPMTGTISACPSEWVAVSPGPVDATSERIGNVARSLARGMARILPALGLALLSGCASLAPGEGYAFAAGVASTLVAGLACRAVIWALQDSRAAQLRADHARMYKGPSAGGVCLARNLEGRR